MIACNLPLISMYLFARYAKRAKLPYVMWHQDIYSAGLSDELRRKLPRPLASLGAKVFVRMEAYCARNASHVVAIGEAFKEVYPAWKVDPENVSVIPNWAPLDKVFPVGRVNRRSAHLFDEETSLRLVYAGTIGRKHNPHLLVELLRERARPGHPGVARRRVQGEAADELAAVASREPELPLRVLPFQPADVLPDVLGSADVLVALLEPEATDVLDPEQGALLHGGRTTDPRPDAAGQPRCCRHPGDRAATSPRPTARAAKSSVAWLGELHTDRELVTTIGRRSREIAEKKFDINTVGKQFESILESAT